MIIPEHRIVHFNCFCFRIIIHLSESTIFFHYIISIIVMNNNRILLACRGAEIKCQLLIRIRIASRICSKAL